MFCTNVTLTGLFWPEGDAINCCIDPTTAAGLVAVIWYAIP